MDVGARIKDLLTDRDIKHKTIAKAIKVNSSSFSNYITGANKIPYDVLVSIAAYLNVTTDYLLGVTDQPELPVTLSSSEQSLIRSFRALSQNDRAFVTQLVQLRLEEHKG